MQRGGWMALENVSCFLCTVGSARLRSPTVWSSSFLVFYGALLFWVTVVPLQSMQVSYVFTALLF